MTLIEQFEQQLAGQGAESALGWLADNFRQQGEYHQLFEALKMRARLESGLPLLYRDEMDSIGGEQQQKFEQRLVAACREVGELLFASGQPGEAWVYFQAVGDRPAARQLLRQVPVDDDNLDAIIQVAVNEGVAVDYGYQLLLEHRGTCNSITAYDSQIAYMPMADREKCAELLVSHLYREIAGNVCGHIQQEEGAEPELELDAAGALTQLMESRDWLFAGGGHHIDTTHLASTVRIARYVRDSEALARAAELCRYGLRLDAQFHFDGDEPFTHTYEDHLRFFAGLQGQGTQELNAWFYRKLAEEKAGYGANLVREIFVDYLARSGQFADAMQVALQGERQSNQTGQPLGIAPGLFDLAQMSGDFATLEAFYQERDDLLSQSVCRLLSQLPS